MTSMTKPGKTLWIDIETYSSIDLAKAGVYKYAKSQDFTVLLFAYAYNDDPVQVIDLTQEINLPWQICRDLEDPSVLKIAHNAAFERICLSAHLRECWWDDPGGQDPYYLSPEGWYCTMVHASMCGLPASLKQLGEAVNLAEDEKKLESGTRLIKYFCKPCKPTKVNGERTRNLPAHEPEGWEEFIRYNRMDVETERHIEKRLDQIYRMPETELRRYWVDQQINDTGVQIDMDMVRKILAYSAIHKERVLSEAAELTGINVKSTPQLKAWLKERAGVSLPDTRKETIETLVSQTDLLDVKRALELRLEANKTSVKKYEAFASAVTDDSRIHGCFQFYGSRTGRFAGRLVQPQNLPRNSFENFHAARRMVKNEDWEMLGACYGSANDVFSTLIRTAFVPAEGYALAVADYSAIEARVIAWLADERWRLEAFHEGKDIYCESASRMFKVPVVKHGENGHLRKQGKIAELALGYGGNVAALCAFHADDFMTMTEMTDIVDKWRKASPRICQLWRTMESMIRKALSGRTAEGPKGMQMAVRNGVLQVKLPSGRRLIYQKPRYETFKGREQFCFTGLNQTTKKWEAIFSWGGKFTENISQAIARDCLCTLMDRMQKYWPECRIVMHIHDEIVVEVPKGEKEKWLQTILDVMAEPIEWAPGLELKGAGFTAEYYQKD